VKLFCKAKAFPYMIRVLYDTVNFFVWKQTLESDLLSEWDSSFLSI
jgi:hypothetical protein